MNAKILAYKERLQNMLLLIDNQEMIEDCFDFDQNHVKQKEDEMIEKFSAELVALNQLTVKQMGGHESNVKSLGTLVVHENGTVEALN
jgi:uncharacterized protein YggL (DUF469 family)